MLPQQGRLRETEIVRPAETAGALGGMGAEWGDGGAGGIGGRGAAGEGTRRPVPILGTIAVDGVVEKIISRRHVWHHSPVTTVAPQHKV